MKKNIATYLKSVPKNVWILLAIIAVGIFLRTYNFHDWLYFYPDQARDVMIVDDVLSGKSQWPLLGPIAASTPFRLGPIYYYFQIISAKIFGSAPQTVAYPDVFFGILSIPLLYYFLKRFFTINTALILAGLYSISFYAIRYSRFAWNSNPIPFFALLFLISLLEFLEKKGKTHWGWIMSIGITIGIGIQLHTVMLVLLPMTAFFACVYTLKKDWRVWKKWIFIILISIILNVPQIISESRTNFKNTKYFLDVLNDRSPQEGSGFLNNAGLDVICTAQVNTLFLSSLNSNDSCENFSDLKYDDGAKEHVIFYTVALGSVCLGLLILLFGYSVLVRYFLKEKEERKKIFLGLIILYATLSFIILLPVIGTNGVVRYLLPIIFIPFIFLGFLIEYLARKKTASAHTLIILIILLLIGTNFFTVASEADKFFAKERSGKKYVVLGEIEPMVNFIMKESAPRNKAYVWVANTDYFWNYFKPLLYVSGKNNFDLFRVKSRQEVPSNATVYYISASGDNDFVSKKTNSQIDSFKNFGNIGIYKLKN